MYIVASVASKELKLYEIYKHCGTATSRFFTYQNVTVNAVWTTSEYFTYLYSQYYSRQNVQNVHLQLQCKPSVTFKILSQPCRLVSEAGYPRLTATFLNFDNCFHFWLVLMNCDIPLALPLSPHPRHGSTEVWVQQIWRSRIFWHWCHLNNVILCCIY